MNYLHPDLRDYRNGVITLNEFRRRIAAQSRQNMNAYEMRIVDCGGFRLRIATDLGEQG
jgi:hypothetical protein